ncbi:MAG: tRNA (guanosine(46)-N7)-methyltransferase TrmB [Hyphomicrobiaceae bacterium]
MPDRDQHELRSFGRRRTRKLTPRQDQLLAELLPRVTIDLSTPASRPLDDVFGNAFRAYWLEIGFGGGEHLIWQAKNNPDVGFIACEPFIDGTVKVLDAINSSRLTNIRLYCDDARDVVRWLPPASIARCFILFPDPWPKKRHNKRRLINPALLDLLSGPMTQDGELRMATDIGDYARAILLTVQRHDRYRWLPDRPENWRQRPADWPATRYERKAIREGRKSYYFRVFRT